MLGLQFFHHIVQLAVQLGHKRHREHESHISDIVQQISDDSVGV